MNETDHIGLTDTPKMVDAAIRRSAIERGRAQKIVLPTFAQLSSGTPIPEHIASRLPDVDPDAPHPDNLWRIHWRNAPDRRHTVSVPDHIVLPKALTGVEAPIVVMIGSRFPMIGAHKVLPAYACLVVRLVTGGFDPARHHAVWPSTGNYCRGGVAVSRILGCAGVAVLPEGMSRERFEWLARWVRDPSHIIRTVGTESNVKEIYDKCRELSESSDNVILNQFSSFSNYAAHYVCTGEACGAVFDHLSLSRANIKLAAFVSATGSAGTIAAGDYLKERYGSAIAAVEALECPTMLENGYGEHNIQGIGDKHIPLIHNVMNTDAVIAVSDRDTDRLNLAFNSPEGAAYFASRKDIDPSLAAVFGEIGISSWANILASIKLARSNGYGPNDAIVTVATDSARLYRTEADGARSRFFPGGFGAKDAASVVDVCLTGASSEHVLLLGPSERRRIFNLGYYTWVEQQGISIEDFDRRKDQQFWREVADSTHEWDRLITEFNLEAGVN
jgi:cysteine synthase A